MSYDFDRPWAKGLRALIFKQLVENGPMDTHGLANRCQVSVKAVAPRMTELESQGLIRQTPFLHRSVSGKGRKLKVWEAVK